VPRDASELATRAFDLAVEHKGRGHQARALLLRGKIASRCDPPDFHPAEGLYRHALTLAEELGMRPLVAHCHLGHGRLYRRTGDQAKAQEHLATATAMYREMGMAHWLREAEALLQQIA
jgi:Tetratricopeptide repeat